MERLAAAVSSNEKSTRIAFFISSSLAGINDQLLFFYLLVELVFVLMVSIHS